MEIIRFFPNNGLIRKYIECYHLFNYEEKHIKQTVFIYPHYLNTLSLQNNYLSVFSGNQFTFQKLKNKKPNLGIIGGFTKPLFGEMVGRIKALSIVFKPAGISFFCDKSFDEIVPNGFNYFPYWNGKLGELEELLYCNDTSEITKRLDAILLSFYRPFKNEILFETLSLLHSNYADYTVSKLEHILNINRKTLLRQFKKHIGVSITDYRRILRFRDVINLHSATDENLTRLAYETCFSDQSHFIKDVRKLTGDNPKKLFKEAGFVKGTPVFLKIS
jgi:AraC-like DNA-binding protein